MPYVQLIAPAGAVASRQQPIPVDEEEIMTFAVLPEQHLQYSATWFSLSAVTLGMACRDAKENAAAATTKKSRRAEHHHALDFVLY